MLSYISSVRPGPKRLIVLTTNKQSKQCLSSVAGPEQTTNKQQHDIYLLFVDDQHRNTNMNDRDHLVGQLTNTLHD